MTACLFNLVMCFEMADKRLLELQFKLNTGAAVLQRGELKEVVSGVGGAVELSTGHSHIDVVGSLGPEDEDSGDGGVNWSVQRNPKLPVIDSDGERIDSWTWIIFRVKQKSQMKESPDTRINTQSDDESKNDSFQIPIMDNNSLDTSCWSLIRIPDCPSRMGISSCHWSSTVNTRRQLVETRQTRSLIG